MRTDQWTLAALGAQLDVPLGISSASWRFSYAAVPVGQVPSALMALTGRLSPLPADQGRGHVLHERRRVGRDTGGISVVLVG